MSRLSFKVFREKFPDPNPGIGRGDRMVKEAMAHIIQVHPFPVETMVGPWIDLQDYFLFGFFADILEEQSLAGHQSSSSPVRMSNGAFNFVSGSPQKG